MRRIITSYNNPDLDGVSAMYAYSEYLNKLGIENKYYIHGTPKREVKIVCDMFNIKLNNVKQIEADDKIIIVDTNNLEEVPFVDHNNIIEIIDHHSVNESSKKCKNAQIQIERIGAVATLIAEKFKNNNFSISRQSAILLYYGIISNSINLKANITSKKDIEMARWLEKQCNEISKEKIRKIFELKSKIEKENLREEMEAEIVFKYKNKSVTIAQLELVDVKDFLSEYETDITSILKQIKKQKSLDYIFINCIDILNGFNIILTIDNETEEFLNHLLGYEFKNRRCEFKTILQRKDLSRMIRNA